MDRSCRTKLHVQGRRRRQPTCALDESTTNLEHPPGHDIMKVRIHTYYKMNKDHDHVAKFFRVANPQRPDGVMRDKWTVKILNSFECEVNLPTVTERIKLYSSYVFRVPFGARCLPGEVAHCAYAGAYVPVENINRWA